MLDTRFGPINKLACGYGAANDEINILNWKDKALSFILGGKNPLLTLNYFLCNRMGSLHSEVGHRAGVAELVLDVFDIFPCSISRLTYV